VPLLRAIRFLPLGFSLKLYSCYGCESISR
jgi:hypothetical protein